MKIHLVLAVEPRDPLALEKSLSWTTNWKPLEGGWFEEPPSPAMVTKAKTEKRPPPEPKNWQISEFDNPDHARVAHVTNQLMRNAGLKAPKGKLVMHNGKLALAREAVPQGHKRLEELPASDHNEQAVGIHTLLNTDPHHFDHFTPGGDKYAEDVHSHSQGIGLHLGHNENWEPDTVRAAVKHLSARADTPALSRAVTKGVKRVVKLTDAQIEDAVGDAGFHPLTADHISGRLKARREELRKHLASGELAGDPNANSNKAYAEKYDPLNYSRDILASAPPRVLGEPGENLTREQQLKRRDALKRELSKKADEGKFGAGWYRNSARAVKERFGGDIDKIRKYAALLAIYSPQSTPHPNTEAAERALQHHLGGGAEEALRAGGTKVQNDNARALLYHNHWHRGLKTNAFYRNLMHYIEEGQGEDRPPTAEELQRNKLRPVTIDRWAARSLGYDLGETGKGELEEKRTVNPSWYRFGERLLNEVAHEKGISPHELQERMWVAEKGMSLARKANISEYAKQHGLPVKKFMEDIGGVAAPMAPGGLTRQLKRLKIDPSSKMLANQNFQTGLQQMGGHIVSSLHPDPENSPLEGLEKLPHAARAELHSRLLNALHENNRFIPASEAQMGGDVPAHVTPHGHLLMGAAMPRRLLPESEQEGKTSAKIALARSQMDPAAARRARGVGHAVAHMLGLKGFDYQRPVHVADVHDEDRNAISLKTGELAPHELHALQQAVSQRVGANIIPVPHGEGVYFVNHSKLPNTDFHKAVEEASQEVLNRYQPGLIGTLARDRPDVESGLFNAPGERVEDTSEGHKNGAIARLGPHLSGRIFAQLASRLRPEYEQFARKHKLKLKLPKAYEEALAEGQAGPGALARSLASFAFSLRALKGQPDWHYHGTNVENARDIAEQGLVPHRPWYGTDQRAWPDGSTEKRSYFTADKDTTRHFFPEEGKPAVLRVRNANFKRESTGDKYVTHHIKPQDIEIEAPEGWRPITEHFSKASSSFSLRALGSRPTIVLAKSLISPLDVKTAEKELRTTPSNGAIDRDTAVKWGARFLAALRLKRPQQEVWEFRHEALEHAALTDREFFDQLHDELGDEHRVLPRAEDETGGKAQKSGRPETSRLASSAPLIVLAKSSGSRKRRTETGLGDPYIESRAIRHMPSNRVWLLPHGESHEVGADRLAQQHGLDPNHLEGGYRGHDGLYYNYTELGDRVENHVKWNRHPRAGQKIKFNDGHSVDFLAKAARANPVEDTFRALYRAPAVRYKSRVLEGEPGEGHSNIVARELPHVFRSGYRFSYEADAPPGHVTHGFMTHGGEFHPYDTAKGHFQAAAVKAGSWPKSKAAQLYPATGFLAKSTWYQEQQERLARKPKRKAGPYRRMLWSEPKLSGLDQARTFGERNPYFAVKAVRHKGKVYLGANHPSEHHEYIVDRIKRQVPRQVNEMAVPTDSPAAKKANMEWGYVGHDSRFYTQKEMDELAARGGHTMGKSFADELAKSFEVLEKSEITHVLHYQAPSTPVKGYPGSNVRVRHGLMFGLNAQHKVVAKLGYRHETSKYGEPTVHVDTLGSSSPFAGADLMRHIAHHAAKHRAGLDGVPAAVGSQGEEGAPYYHHLLRRYGGREVAAEVQPGTAPLGGKEHDISQVPAAVVQRLAAGKKPPHPVHDVKLGREGIERFKYLLPGHWKLHHEKPLDEPERVYKSSRRTREEEKRRAREPALDPEELTNQPAYNRSVKLVLRRAFTREQLISHIRVMRNPSGRTPEEARTYSAAAANLMQRHGIAEHEIAGQPSPTLPRRSRTSRPRPQPKPAPRPFTRADNEGGREGAPPAEPFKSREEFMAAANNRRVGDQFGERAAGYFKVKPEEYSHVHKFYAGDPGAIHDYFGRKWRGPAMDKSEAGHAPYASPYWRVLAIKDGPRIHAGRDVTGGHEWHSAIAARVGAHPSYTRGFINHNGKFYHEKAMETRIARHEKRFGTPKPGSRVLFGADTNDNEVVEPIHKSHKLHYKTTFAGLPISIENRRGTYRHWHDHNGREGRTLMQHPYGYINRTEGADGDHVDCFLGPNENATHVHVITTMKPPHFQDADEEKAMLGFNSQAEAEHAFHQHYNDPRFMGAVERMPLGEFRAKVMRTRNDPGMVSEAGNALAI